MLPHCFANIRLAEQPFQEEKIQFAVEALRRASAKFAGRQKVHVSNKFGFTKYTKKDPRIDIFCDFLPKNFKSKKAICKCVG